MENTGRYRVGVDIGGTFTDCVVLDLKTGEVVEVAKAPTTPADPSLGFLAAIRATDIALDEVERVVHGCTVGLNAIITRTGSRTGLLTTAGFRDVLAMGRGQRPPQAQFDPSWRRDFGDASRPFIPRHLRRPVVERIGGGGKVVVPLDEASLQEELEYLLSQEVEAIAICFINSFANPDHERRAKEIVAEVAPDIYCWNSTEVHPCFKEYPRFSTCALNSYVGPLVDRYFRRTEAALQADGYGGSMMIMQSNGGVLPAPIASERPAYTLQSGPTAGVSAARYWAGCHGHEQVLTLDIGGTSADYAMIDQGEPVLTTELELSHDVVVALPAVNVHSIGAGGGSIAWIDEIGALRVGPASAGADPGPACYGNGGTEPTLTDALVAAGFLPSAAFQSSPIGLQPELAAQSLEGIAEALGADVPSAAESVIKMGLANLVEAAREVSVGNGVDPRDFALYVYGAAGPLFGSRVGRELGVQSVVVPPLAGALSAFGLSLSEMRTDLSSPVVAGLEEIDPDALTAVFEDLETRAQGTLAGHELVIERWIDGRYVGQTWETPSVPVPLGSLGSEQIAETRASFDSTHKRLWGYDLQETGVTVNMARITASVPDRGGSRSPSRGISRTDSGPIEPTRVFIDGDWQEAPVMSRESLAAGEPVRGPAVILERTTTIVLMPGDEAVVDGSDNVHITWEQSR